MLRRMVLNSSEHVLQLTIVANFASHVFPHCMECQRRVAMRKMFVHPSISVCQTHESVQIFIPYERSFSLVFWKKNDWW